MTIAITTFANQAGPIPLGQLDANFANVVAAVDANAASTAAAFAALGATPISFTPGIAFGGGATGLTYSAVRTGAYVLVGNIVLFTLDVKISNKGSSTGFAVVTGLPFAASSSFPPGGSAPTVGVTVGSLTFASGYITGICSGTTLILLNPDNGAGFSNVLQDTNFTNNTEICCTGFYLR